LNAKRDGPHAEEASLAIIPYTQKVVFPPFLIRYFILLLLGCYLRANRLPSRRVEKGESGISGSTAAAAGLPTPHSRHPGAFLLSRTRRTIGGSALGAQDRRRQCYSRGTVIVKHVRAGGSFRRKQPWRPHQRTPCDTLELAKTMLTMLLKCQPPRLGAAENAEME
jgi:hypothetical protein